MAPHSASLGQTPSRDRASEIAGWRFLVLVEIGNYAMLRRHVGARRAETIAADVVTGLRALSATTDARVAGRNLIELHFHGCSRQELDAQLAVYEALFTVPVDLDAEPHLIDVAIGAAAADKGTGDDVRLIEEAERALADARAERRPVVRDVTQTQVVLDHIALARDLPTAIATEQLFLQYQPKLHVRQQKVTSVEALVRWRHPVRGLILPNDFIPLAEQSRDIGAMTLWTIRRVVVDQRAMREREREHRVRVFINISGVLLGDPAFVAEACAIIAASDADIGFEITETAVIRDPQSAIAHLQMFADIGITIAIDDYGAGLSSLAYLKQLPARELKIDKLFVTQLTSSNRDPLIVRSTIDLAHALEMEVVAEGVETQASFALLSVMGCDMVQGFLISRPVGLDALLTFLDQHDDLLPVSTLPLARTAWGRG